MTNQIEQYLTSRQQQTTYPLRMYGLVDGLLYAEISSDLGLFRSASSIALFDGTPDAALANAGPWLLDCTDNPDSHMASLRQLGDGAIGCVWIISGYAAEDLAAALRARLNVRMPNGSTALLRYYDARITSDIAAILTPAQRVWFFAPAQDWLVQRNGQLTTIHQTHAA
ncbi:DUF4123 domain-containing protein [Achromobacter xylosoxidans]|uniref:DUF4123 domain-containing protein n=1 Tax=Alcaligenes xylosoxydans xylosoxydans TaxID=85698 RepID=UPI0006692CFE|nr:DUF4123 domain-containing protein [Achromobacter xylosoxidans]MCH4576043.1 DUF4123 domain-containing protein [Achromobacter xylosoxidans]MDD7988999.1 DUF4123 domain-containing protein [Achromobacter xylosoxidans]OFO57683.1 hypothetical protein HMPREF3024_05735 [Achromobacter xylosoxidans]OMG79567.1 hypothetical protein BIZ53_11610 [Achromobacter xylosoxidans]